MARTEGAEGDAVETGELVGSEADAGEDEDLPY